MATATIGRRSGRQGRMPLAARVAVGAYLLLSLSPLVWVLKMSVIPRLELFASPPTLLPQDLTLSSYERVLGDPVFLRGILNSVIIASLTTLASLVLGGPAAYALARLRFRGRTVIVSTILALAFFPAAAVIAPLFIQFKAVGILNSYWAVLITDTVFALPVTVWILAAFFRQLPRDLENAARVDGATTLQAFRYVVVPLAAPGVASAAIVTFIVTWNEFIFANTFLFDSDHWPVTVMIPNFATLHTVDYGAQAAAALLVTVPLAAVALAFQRRIVQGLTAGALQG